ncbi:carbohydrate-binding protein [Paenibacillus sp. GCM10012307]|uniref:Carbohydrate-binding protein n=1 Tax=Paenibacillus roseus TaxID=2798579 RepID=A0A934J9B5_9BACL|nr:carbohydrate-binding protein [Paenibacillus roseus]MBJ6363948.1 carbohydrate-binding protein [Paenibacillus roseus]
MSVKRTALKAGLFIALAGILAAGAAVYLWERGGRDSVNVEAWYSSEDGSRVLEQQASLQWHQPGSAAEPIRTFTIDDSITYQPYFGVGSSLEESSVYNLMRMSRENREKVLQYLLDPKGGLGWNVMRITLGTSDFTGREWYSYNDNPPGGEDRAMERFSIQKDIDYNIVPVIQEALRYNPELKIIASAWSVPGWMKDSGRLEGGPSKSGKMKSEYMPALALYYRKAIEAYAEQGIPIYAISLHNEPGIHVDYPMTEFSLGQQIELLKLLKQEFGSTEHGEIIDTQVWVHEFNIYDWELQNKRIYDDPEAYALSDGTAFHDYWGHLSVMTDAHEAHPDKPIYMTERSVWGTRGADRIIQYFRNYARSYNAWVTLLDSRGKPNVSSTAAGRTLVTIDADTPDNYTINFESHMMGHFSRFIRQGALRLDSNYYDESFDRHEPRMNGEEEVRPEVSNIAFRNEDGAIVMIVVNNSRESRPFRVLYADGEWQDTLPGKTVATYRWKEAEKGTFKERVKVPTVNPQDGSVFGEIQATLASATESAEIRYTLDGSVPGASSTLYTGPIAIKGQGETIQLKAIAMKEGMHDSTIRAVSYPFVLPSVIPGQIEAEAYLAASSGRTEPSSEGGLNIGWVQRGDWLDYPVDVEESGMYRASYRVAGVGAEGNIELQDDGKALAATGLEDTGDWQKWTTIQSEPFLLVEGERVLRLHLDGSGFNLNWFKLERVERTD